MGLTVTASLRDLTVACFAIWLLLVSRSDGRLYRNLVSPGKPTDKSFDEIVKDHLNPTPSVTFQRYSFNTRKQKEGESIAAFVADLRCLSEHCNFVTTLDDMLRDQLLCGVCDKRVQQKLLAEKALTFQKAFETAQGLEIAEWNSKELQAGQSPQKPESILVMHATDNRSPTPSARSQGACYRCGGNNHHPSKCQFKLKRLNVTSAKRRGILEESVTAKQS